MESLSSKMTVKLVLLAMALVVLTGGGLGLAKAYADPAPLQQAENQVAANNSSTDACNNTNSTDKLQQCVRTNPITRDLNIIVNALSAGVGIIIIGMIILGGIQYSIAGDNPQATGAAKQRISNAMIALFAFLFIFAFLQWLIPGGLFG